jgi:hypothetical protein
MDRKIISICIYIVLLLAFAGISVLVVITKRHPFFVEKKLRLGALLISLWSFSINCTGNGGPDPFITCYDPIPENFISISQIDLTTGALMVSSSATTTITGTIDSRVSSHFSFALSDSSGTNIQQKGSCIADDGSFDESTETFSITLEPPIPPGNYLLRFFSLPLDSLKPESLPIRTFSCIVN